MGPETSVTNCQSTLRNISEEGRSRLHHCGSLKSFSNFLPDTSDVLQICGVKMGNSLWEIVSRVSFTLPTYVCTYVQIGMFVNVCRWVYVQVCISMKGPGIETKGSFKDRS